ncbi:hypothetical protein LshimejAT787_0601710 [Lyophyllum shimeji]|uniref:Uncharacterized protein n=1 Tax=Lyophyllum shimeji TaxID=47721 RepID=A0A9P3ULA3_LYOSH|nr:hypothetical protein LshimejAT787_0601710 [Lyophyllum shimeji]
MAGLVLNILNGNDKATDAFTSDRALKWKHLDMWKTVIKKTGSLTATKFGAYYVVRAWKTFLFGSVRSSFGELLLSTPRLKDRIDFIQLEGLPPQTAPEEFEKNSEFRPGEMSSLNIPAIITTAWVKGAVFLVQEILPQLTKNHPIYAFAVAFVKALHDQGDSIPEQRITTRSWSSFWTPRRPNGIPWRPNRTPAMVTTPLTTVVCRL